MLIMTFLIYELPVFWYWPSYISGSAVFMASLTTFAAGAAMMPTRMLAYQELGTFLMLIMTFSWLYSTFFFQSLLCIIGPSKTFCQLSVSGIREGLLDRWKTFRQRITASDSQLNVCRQRIAASESSVNMSRIDSSSMNVGDGDDELLHDNLNEFNYDPDESLLIIR